VEEIRMTPAFVDAYREVWESLREEVEEARRHAA
jgi:NitT/TauT family transport system ATP-binding protein